MLNLDTFYQSRQWQALRSGLMLTRTNADGLLICEKCGKPILKKYDCVAHHKIHLTEDNVNDYAISLNPDNIELVHFRCHNKEHQRYDGFRQYVYLVWGAPCSGKTTWVQENAYDDDLILDLDNLWEAVCKRDRLHKPERLKANVFGLRDTMLEQIRTRKGKWRNAYVIGTYPQEAERRRLCESLRAIPIYIEATKEDCLSRAPSDDWKQYVEEWFEELSPPLRVEKNPAGEQIGRAHV